MRRIPDLYEIPSPRGIFYKGKRLKWCVLVNEEALCLEQRNILKVVSLVL
jgi:hypothetical protein